MSNLFSKDIGGLIKGLQVLQKHSSQMAVLRPVQTHRHLTDKTRQHFKYQKQQQDSERYENEYLKEEKEEEEKMEVERQPIQENLNKNKDKKYVIDPNKGNGLYLKLKQEDSTFGKSQSQQHIDEIDYSDVPFFMRQDRPKFNTVERYVPATAVSRGFQFGILGIQLVGGTISEAIKQKLGISKPTENGSNGVSKYALSEKNVNRLTMNFKKMRGGALKIGQLLSTGEDSVLPPAMRQAFEKARSEADIMPLKQVKLSLENEYGQCWQKHFKEINLFPFAAASIGQVHEAILKDGTRVALKIQYNGVSQSIDSDINNFKRIIDLLGIIPRGLYLNEALDVARGELHWECDYHREAAYQKAYRKHLKPYPTNFYCPKIIQHLTTKTILCSEFVNGVEIDSFVNATQEVRDRIGTLMISLCFKELFEFKMMQTDPNPANYLFDEEENILNLLDLGAGRDFDDKFLDNYMHIIIGAMEDDKELIWKHSENIGFLTGEESRDMYDAQYAGTMVIGEPFRTKDNELYDFGQQGLSKKVGRILPTLSKHRLTPPPQEVYSLHKKIIGTYLMCIKLRARVPARQVLLETFENWNKMHAKKFYNQ